MSGWFVKEKHVFIGRIRVDSRTAECIALLNSGYEAPSPQLLIPIRLAEELGLWPPSQAFSVEFETAGGVLKAWLYPRIAWVKVLADDTESR